ncbi:hypothetical protein C8R42DRAFT_679452 [Lentinula raphanica]|nr:hypothetical protein C8R42DRAFT_679452 [Lentinula raphanica]
MTSSTVRSSSSVDQHQDQAVVASLTSNGHHNLSNSSLHHSVPQSLSPIPISEPEPKQVMQASKVLHHRDQDCVNCRSIQGDADAMRPMQETNINLQSVHKNLSTCGKDCKLYTAAGLKRCSYNKCVHKIETTSSCAASGTPTLFNEAEEFTISGGTFNAVNGDMHSKTNTNQSRTCYINCVFKNHHSNKITPDDEVKPEDSTKETSDGASTEPCQPWTVKSNHKPNSQQRWTTTKFTHYVYHYQHYLPTIMCYSMSWMMHWVPPEIQYFTTLSWWYWWW